jgi:hypothetical protein
MHPEEANVAKAGAKKARARLTDSRDDISWIRYTGQDHFSQKADEGDTTIQIWRSIGGKKATCLKHSPIVLRQNEEKCARFYVVQGEAEGEMQIPLGEFRKLAKKAGAARKIGPNSAREITHDASSVIQKPLSRR